MKDKIKVGYVPYSADLSHPGDRRRLAMWAETTNNVLVLDKPLESDLLVLSGSANYNHWTKNAKQPVVLDLVDGYLGENPNFFSDFGRNFIRSANGNSNYTAITFTRALKNACRKASAVVVASPEQARNVMPFNSNIHIILDDHSELEAARNLRNPSAMALNPHKYVFWEGFGFTIKHFKFVSKLLDEFIIEKNLNLILLTHPKFPRWGAYLGSVDASKLISKWFPLSKGQIEIIPWSIENVIRSASISQFAIIPVDTNDKFANLKPENKLLSMWHLGLPTLFSDTQAYKRVAQLAGASEFCVEREQWIKALSKIESADFSYDLKKPIEYIEKTHTKEILAKKWQTVIDSVLGTNG